MNDFFRVNMPYGMKKNNDDTWFVFNRYYLPLGWLNTKQSDSVFSERPFDHIPVNGKYYGLTDDLIIETLGEKFIERQDGKLHRVYFFSDSTNPLLSVENWITYFDVLSKMTEINKNNG